jgi:hypothetical protein
MSGIYMQMHISISNANSNATHKAGGFSLRTRKKKKSSHQFWVRGKLSAGVSNYEINVCSGRLVLIVLI